MVFFSQYSSSSSQSIGSDNAAAKLVKEPSGLPLLSHAFSRVAESYTDYCMLFIGAAVWLLASELSKQ